MATNTLADKTIKAAIKAATEGGKAQPTGAAWWRLRYWLLAGQQGKQAVAGYLSGRQPV